MVANLRTETYTGYHQSIYPPGGADRGPLTPEINQHSYRTAQSTVIWSRQPS